MDAADRRWGGRWWTISMPHGIGLKLQEVATAFDTEDLRRRFPPILSPAQTAELLGLSPKTIYEWIARGRFDGAFRKRGKHVLLWRDRVLDRIFNGPNWETDDE